MKSQLLCFVLCLCLLSCEKGNDDTPTEKKVDDIFLCTEKPLISKTDKIFVGVRYFKNYSEKDKVTLTLNGVAAVEKGFRVDQIEGTNYYFEFPPIMNAAEVELILTIQNDQNTYIQKKPLKIIENYDLENVWNNLGRTHILASFPFMYYYDIHFGVVINHTINDKPFYDEYDKVMELGIYTPNGLLASTPAFKSFVPGLNGKYTLSYNDQGAVTQIKVSQGNPSFSSQITYEKIVNDVSEVYSPSIAVEYDQKENKITKFQHSKFNLWVYYPLNQEIYTIITLK